MDKKLAASFTLFLEELRGVEIDVYNSFPDWLKDSFKKKKQSFNLLDTIVNDLECFLLYLSSANNEVYPEDFQKEDIFYFTDFYKNYAEYSITKYYHNGSIIENTKANLAMVTYAFRQYPTNYEQDGCPSCFTYLFYYDYFLNKNDEDYYFIKLMDFFTAFGKDYIDNNSEMSEYRYINYDIAVEEIDIQADIFIKHVKERGAI